MEQRAVSLNKAAYGFTESNTVYHLGLSPEHLPDTVIIVEDASILKLLSDHFHKILHKSQHCGFISHLGLLGDKPILAICTGTGAGNMDIVMNELDVLANINFQTGKANPQHRSLNIIHMGSSTALHVDAVAGTMITAAYGIGFDNLLHYYRYENNPDERFIMDDFLRHTRLSGQALQPYIAEGSISLRKHFAAGFQVAITTSAPGFYGPQGKVLRADISYPYLTDALSTFSSRNLRLLNTNMSTAAFYGMGKILGHHCVSIGIVAGYRQSQQNTITFMENAIAHILSIIKHI